MKEIIVYGDTLPEAYHKALLKLSQHGVVCECENQTEKTRQKEVSMTMVIKNPLQEPMISRLWIGGPYDLERYRQEMLDGVLDKMIGHGWDYTYHNRIISFDGIDGKCGTNQYQFVIDELKRCPYSRRAVMSIRSVDDMNTEATDPACWQHAQFLIRNGKLHCKVLFRSNDAVRATFMNAFALIMLQKKIADELGVPIGNYTHRANSFHCYESCFDLLEGYVKRINTKDDLTYDYIGEFDEMMEEEKPRIASLVKHMLGGIEDGRTRREES